MEKYYEIAGVDICVSGKDEEMYTDERMLRAFKTERKENECRFEFCIVQKLEEPMGECIYKSPSKQIFKDGEKEISYIGSVNLNISGAYIRVEKLGRDIQVQVLSDEIRGRITSKVVLNSLGLERLVVSAGGFILHASYIDWNGKAILFTAPSGTGKSTQADLWNKFRGAQIINGDRAIVRCAAGQFYACGLPFAGSSSYCENVTTPLAAIVYLGQAEKTEIKSLSGSKAFKGIWEGCSIATWEQEDVKNVFTLIQNLIQSVPIYELKCTPDESAIIALEEVLGKER